MTAMPATATQIEDPIAVTSRSPAGPSTTGERSAPVVTISPAPRREPPFDDELVSTGRHLSVVGPYDQPLPFALATRLDRPSGLRLVHPRDAFAARPTSRLALPDPAIWSRRLLTTMFEVVAGRRPARQLSSLATAAVCAGFTAAAGRHGRLGRLVSASRPPQIRSVHVSEPADGVAEVAAVIVSKDRCHAIAMRLEGLDGRWRCVRLQVG